MEKKWCLVYGDHHVVPHIIEEFESKDEADELCLKAIIQAPVSERCNFFVTTKEKFDEL